MDGLAFGLSATSGFMPHGMCFMWTPWILWTHVSSDLITGFSYFSIPIVMAIFVMKRPEVKYVPAVYLFMTFIVLCGTTHFMSTVVIWNPLYEIQAILKAATALISLVTAIMLWPLLPKALAVPSPKELSEKNAELADEVVQRKQAEEELTALTRSLESRIAERTQELTQSNEALRQYAATASHDLQAPIRHITMFAQMLEREAGESLSPDGKELLTHISDSAVRMRRMIGSLLEYSKLVDHDTKMDRVDLADVAKASVAALKPDLDAVGAKVEIDLPHGVNGDRDLLSRLFENLIDNAVKYRSDTPLEIRLSSEQAGEFITVSIADNGIGIPKEAAKRVFEMLRRLHADAEIPGTGIGLSLCQRIVERHGGEISLDTGYTNGARFLFTLPAAN